MQSFATLTKRREFVAASKAGIHIATAGLILQAYAHEQAEERPCVGFTVSRKVGNAVVRNRVRRRLRALWQELAPSLAHARYAYVIVGRRAAYDRAYRNLKRDLVFAFHHIHKQLA